MESPTSAPPVCPGRTSSFADFVVPSSQRSRRLPVCVWLNRTVLRPEKTPMADPMTMSLAQCLSSYMRDRPTSEAPPYMTGAMYHVECGHHSDVSAVTAAAAEKAAVA